jgi:hypothetical protein
LSLPPPVFALLLCLGAGCSQLQIENAAFLVRSQLEGESCPTHSEISMFDL